jgi:predicted RNA binding protein YcfA (HicA-like mRNA interferase family)
MKLPRDVSGADVARTLRRLGFIIQRQTGSHLVLRREGRTVVVPEISQRDAVRVFHKIGFRVARSRGHIVMTNGRTRLIMPRHSSVVTSPGSRHPGLPLLALKRFPG